MFSVAAPMPTLDQASVKELKSMLAAVKAASKEVVRGGVVSEGDAASYALVWEWGNARQTKQGPKTVRSTNPDGEEVWLSIQAPHGYIRVNEPEFTQILQTHLAATDFGEWQTASDITDAIKKASVEAAKQITEVIKETAPIESGALRDSISPANPDDPDLATEDEEIELGIGFAHHAFMRTLREQSE